MASFMMRPNRFEKHRRLVLVLFGLILAVLVVVVNHRPAYTAIRLGPAIAPTGLKADLVIGGAGPGFLVIETMRGGQHQLRLDQRAGAEPALAHQQLADRLPALDIIGGAHADKGAVIGKDRRGERARGKGKQDQRKPKHRASTAFRFGAKDQFRRICGKGR